MKMAKMQLMRALVSQRLNAAAEEIFGVVQRTIAEYEEEACRSKQEIERQRKLLDAVLKPEIKLHRTGHQQPPAKQQQEQDWSLSLDYDSLEPQPIGNELWANQGGDDILKFIFTPTGIKSECDQGQTKSAHHSPTQSAVNPKEDSLPSTSTEQRTELQGGENFEVTEASGDFQPLSTDGSAAQSEGWNSSDDDDDDDDDGGGGGGGDDWERSESPQSALKAKSAKMQSSSAKVRKPKKSYAVPHGCKVCGKSFMYITALKNHVQKHTKDTDFCGLCGEHFEAGENLRLHLQTHVAAKACELCGKRFGSHADMIKHLRIHTGEKPYLCSICGKGFHLNGNLNKHMRVHTGEKPFLCTFCGKRFRQNVGLKYHLATHTGDKPHRCHICGKEFPMKYGLKHHLKIHSDERPYKCAVCGKGCYQSSHLKKHMLSHLRK
ncbi:uncharacterized protein LOC139914545 [Centroberyx gerrardi]